MPANTRSGSERFPCRSYAGRRAQGKSRAADRLIAQSAAHERHYFVAPGFGPDEIRLLGVELQQLVLKRREPEKIILFFHRFRRASALGTRSPRPNRIHVEFIEDTILAAVRTFVDVAVVAT